MDTTKKSRIMRICSLILILFLVAPIYANATNVEIATPKASDYLNSYNTYLYREAFGGIQVWFSVTGIDYMDEIGSLNIKLYESTDGETWNWVATYKHNTTSGMLGHDKIYHSGHIDYQGTIGRYYKAYVCIWAGKDGDGDTRYMWTDVQKATLFAG